MGLSKKAKKKRGYRHKIGDRWRGKGSSGGKGKAGRGKRGQHNRAIFPPLGKKGFVSKCRKRKAITLRELEKLVLAKGLVGKEIDLTKEGYDKLLGSGKINVAVKVIVRKATERAISRITNAGGEVIIK